MTQTENLCFVSVIIYVRLGDKKAYTLKKNHHEWTSFSIIINIIFNGKTTSPLVWITNIRSKNGEKNDFFIYQNNKHWNGHSFILLQISIIYSL